jgi:tetratricopeptide (TPR) repeat protein
MAAREYGDAAGVLQEFVARSPSQIPALLKLVEVCVDGGLESTMYETQAQLADAYIAAGRASEARVIAEDLVAREPWEQAHIDRFRKALVMLRVSDPDTHIAERLSGQAPFMATDPFFDLGDGSTEPAASGATPPPEPAPSANAATETPVDTAAAPAAPPAPAPAPVRSTAAADRGEEIDLTTMLGRLYRDQQDVPHAIEWLERAAEAPAPTIDDARTLLYDLGTLLEVHGENARALAVFLELQAEATDFRDVAGRVERLARVQAGG